MARRAITRADESKVRERVAKAVGFGDERIALEWSDGEVIQIQIVNLASTYREPSQSERRMLAAVGIFPGANGWEIEEAEPAKVDTSPRSPLSILARAIVSGANEGAIALALDVWGKSLTAPSPRTTDGALTAYLLEHYPDEWRPGEDALALAIRLLGETQAVIDSAQAEATAADASANELAAELTRVRGELNTANESAKRNGQGWANVGAALDRALEEKRDLGAKLAAAERELSEARADLAVYQGAIRGLAAKMGAPNG